MCIGIPMRVLHIDNGMAECAGQGRSERLNLMLVGDVPLGTWVLAHQGSALRTMSEDEALRTGEALAALEAALAGNDVDAFFADLIAREPRLPPHLKDTKA